MTTEFKMVPQVATPDMKNAGWHECERQGIDPESIEMQTIWTATLDAAPASPQAAQPVAELQVAFFEHGPMATINWFTPSAFEPGTTKVYTHADTGELKAHCHLQRARLAEQERDTLRVQLAERDALLEKGRYYGDFKWQAAIDALSTTTEPEN